MKKKVCFHSWSGARHQRDVGCHVVNRQAASEHVVYGPIQQFPKLRPHEGQHARTEDPLEQFACKVRSEVSPSCNVDLGQQQRRIGVANAKECEAVLLDNSDTSSWLSRDNALIEVQLHLRTRMCQLDTRPLHPPQTSRTDLRRSSLTNQSASRRGEPHLQNYKHLCRRMQLRITAE